MEDVLLVTVDVELLLEDEEDEAVAGVVISKMSPQHRTVEIGAKCGQLHVG